MEATETIPAVTLPRTCRVLYYGPAGSGKSANLRHLGECVPAAYRVPVPAPVPGERLAFRVDAGELGSWLLIAEAIDPVENGDELPVRGGGFAFDGVVFVADSSASRLDHNLSALESLKTWFEWAGLDFTSVAMVIQYNKQDVEDSLPLAQLESMLNPWGLPSFTAVAKRGVGVRETLRAVLGLSLRHLDRVARGETFPDDDAPPDGDAYPSCDLAPDRDDAARPAAPAPGPAAAPRPADDRLPPVMSPQPLQIEPQTDEGVLFAERRAPVVVPVRVPRSLLERHGTVRVVLEIELDEKGTGLL